MLWHYSCVYAYARLCVFSLGFCAFKMCALTFICVYEFSPPLVTVSKSAELSSLYYAEWEEASKLIQADSPHGLPTCRVSLSSDKDTLCCSVRAVTQELCLIG